MKGPVSRDKIIILLTEENEKFIEYTQLCSYYQIQPDELATVRHLSKIQTLRLLMDEK